MQGWAGTQRYSICWTGDQYGSWDLIRYHIPTLIGSGLSGQAYATTDVDGIFGGSPETYTRDMQWKCFTPVLYAMNGWSNINKSPWSYDEPYRSIIRRYLKLKMRLTPYMYKYAREAWDTGAPIVRGMVWEFPDDPVTYDIYPYGKSEFTLYEDDGVTRKFKLGESATQSIRVEAPIGIAGDIDIRLGPSTGEFDGKLTTRVYEFLVHTELEPVSITVNGETLPKLANPDAYVDEQAAWYFDPAERRGVARLKLSRRQTDKPVNVHIDIDESQKIPPSPAYPIPEVTPDLDRTQFVVRSRSQNPGGPVTNAFDGTPETIWHSKYGKKAGPEDQHPYTVDIALGGLYPINGLRYMPRQIGNNGMLKDFEVYVGRSADSFGKPVFKGAFTKDRDMQEIQFPASWGEYVRLRFLNSQHDDEFASAAEFELTQDLKAKPLPDRIAYLSDLKPASSKGEFKMDRSVGGQPLTVNEQTYKKGIGALSGSEIVYKLDGSWDKLYGHVGMDDEVGDGGSVMFRVYADGKIVFESPEQSGKSVKQLMELNIKGVKELKLVLLDAGDGPKDDHGDWVDAKLILEGSEAP